MNSLNEEWRDVVGYEGFYQVSSLGRVRSLDRYVDGKMCCGRRLRNLKRGRILSQKIDRYGYPCVALCGGEKPWNVTVHRLVAIAFIGGNFEGAQVNHIDGNKTNNVFSNLEFCTSKENSAHAVALGLQKGRKGVDHHNVFLTEDDVREIKSMLSRGISQPVIAARFGVNSRHISRINCGHRWSHIS